MLTPGAIPDHEPKLRVGIVLPDDDFTSLSLMTPVQEDYQLEFSGRTIALKSSQPLFFKHDKNRILIKIDQTEFSAPSEISCYPIRPSARLQPTQGMLVKNVISGRGFHWKKYINVTLPGTLIISRHENKLILTNELDLEQYLMCVATSEMGAACPPALIEAQTIAARSWMLANVEQKHRSLGMDVCNDDCCQRYQGTTFLSEQSVEGALNTFGQVLMYNNNICDARYSKSCGGVMESFETIWGEPGLPYMQIKADAETQPEEWQRPLSDEDNFKIWVESVPHTFCSPHVIPEQDLKQYLGNVDEEGQYFRWDTIIDQKELQSNLHNFHQIKAKKITGFKVLGRGGSGRINRLEILYLDADGNDRTLILNSEYAVRQTMSRKFLFSSAFTIEPLAENGDDGFRLKGAGWGHGAGLCQIGALGMSLKGYPAEDIVLHYYPGAVLQRIYSK